MQVLFAVVEVALTTSCLPPLSTGKDAQQEISSSDVCMSTPHYVEDGESTNTYALPFLLKRIFDTKYICFCHNVETGVSRITPMVWWLPW